MVEVEPAPANPVNHKKLPGSKWTAARPENKEKHFIVLDWELDENGNPTGRVEIEAVLTGRVRRIRWRELHDAATWKVGWR